MKSLSLVLNTLAALYEKSRAGRTGQGSIDFQTQVEYLLKKAGALDGDSRELAIRDLKKAEGAGVVRLELANKRVRSDDYHKVRIAPEKEAEFYKFVGRIAPTEERARLSGLFAQSADNPAVPIKWRPHWKNFCERLSLAALNGDALPHFDRKDPGEVGELLALLPKLLAWPETSGESLVRFASCVLCANQNSKRLEKLAEKEKSGEFEGKLRGRLGKILEIITEGNLRTLDDVGILANPRFGLVHGPIRLLFEDAWLDLGLLHGPCRISLKNIQRAQTIETTALRCVTVENETSFHELVKLQSGVLLVQTSYPGSATVQFLRKVNGPSEFWHFGDSDEDGFAILQVLREKSGRDFRPIHMERGRVPFEQETFGPPPHRDWPFYY